jgi:dethiobiotin synthetase
LIMSQGVFITGTGTGVGKTVVTAGIIRWLRGKGIDAVPVKPVQTGGLSVNGALVSPDLEFCLSTAGIQAPESKIALMAPYIYAPACSPHLAGRIKGEYPKIAHIQTCVETLSSSCNMVVVEGAGGVMVPLDEQATMLDLMKSLNFPVVLVAHAGLGTINHSLLSIQALRTAGLKISGVVFNEMTPGSTKDDFIKEDNIETVAKLGRVDVLGNIAYLEGLCPHNGDLWDQFEKNMTGMQKILEGVDRR